VNGAFAGWASSQVTGWRNAPGPGPSPDLVLPDRGWLPPEAPLSVRWDSPDRLAGGGPQDYALRLQLRVATRYPDGVTAELIASATVSATVFYTAQND
jgi:hypothetical protein